MKHEPFSYDELSAFCLSLAHLLHAGLSVGDALTLMAQDEPGAERSALLREMAGRADDGDGLSLILKEAGMLPPYVQTLSAAGEETGRVEEAMFALADYYEHTARLERGLRAALTQPLVLLGVLGVVAAAILIWVLPVFDEVYRQLGASLTGFAGGLLGLGKILRTHGLWLLLGLLAAGGGCLWLFGSRRGREKLLAVLSGKGVFRHVETARLTRVVAMALSSGLDAERAMELACGLARPGTEFFEGCKSCIGRLSGGEPLSRALRESGALSAADCRLLEAGERAGCADTVMQRLAQRTQEESQRRLEQWLDRIEPALVLAGSILVGTILLCVLLPLTRIMAAIG